jgi:hypothetical protein
VCYYYFLKQLRRIIDIMLISDHLMPFSAYAVCYLLILVYIREVFPMSRFAVFDRFDYVSFFIYLGGERHGSSGAQRAHPPRSCCTKRPHRQLEQSLFVPVFSG